MKKQIALLFIAVFLLSFAYANYPLCQEETDVSDIPCLGLTNIINCSGNISVKDVYSSSQYNITTSLVGGDIYNFTFNFNNGSYSLKNCFNSTATITVGNYSGIKSLTWLFIVSVIIAFSLFILSFIKKEMIYSNMAGILLIADGIIVLTNNILQIVNLGNLINLAVGALLVGIGAICLIYNFFEEGRD